MAAPENRVPVRLARGNKATLDASIADIYEGEIVYAIDEDSLYVKEGGVLVQAGAGGSNPVVSIDDLSDVDTSTAAPTDGQVLTWNDTNGEWEPATAASGSIAFADLTDYGAPVSYTNYDGVSDFTGTDGGIYYANGSARLSVSDTDEVGFDLTDANIAQIGDFVEISIDGGATWPEGVTVTAQSAVPSDDFGFWRFDHDGPVDWPSNLLGVFETGNDIRLRWPGSGGGTPSNGDLLTYTNAQWIPTTPAPTVSAVDDLTDVTLTGEASGEVLVYDGVSWVNSPIFVGSLADVRVGVVTSGTKLGAWSVNSVSPPAAQGEWRSESYNELRIFFTDSEGTDIETAFDALPTTGTVYLIPDGDTSAKTAVTYTGVTNQTTYGRLIGTSIDQTWNDLYDAIEIYTTDPTTGYPTSGMVLKYDPGIAAWRAGDITKVSSSRPVYVDNTAAKAGGLVDGDLYRTATGVLQVVYT